MARKLYLTVKHNAAFVARYRADWKETIPGLPPLPQSEESGEKTAGTNWTVTLDEEAKDFNLNIEHFTGIVWAPTNTTYTHFWDSPAMQWKDGKATISIHGTTLIGYGGEWVDKP